MASSQQRPERKVAKVVKFALAKRSLSDNSFALVQPIAVSSPTCICVRLIRISGDVGWLFTYGECRARSSCIPAMEGLLATHRRLMRRST
jgi:hypothetical protein